MSTVALTLPGSDARFVEALGEASPRLRGLAVRMLGNPTEAEDVLQEAWLRAWRNRDRLQDPEAMQGWLRQILVRECLRALRWRSLRKLLPWDAERFDPPSTTPGAEQQFADAERKQKLQEAVSSLSPRQRLVFGLRFDEGWTLPEIAASTGMSSETVKTHLSRAVSAVQQKMETP